MLTDSQIIAKYGQPGDADNFTVIDLPYPFRIAWDTSKTVRRMQCHKLAAEPFTNVFKAILSHYGLPEIQRLGIDLFGGCVNVRLLRGSKTKWSDHAWGAAVDIDPARNGLRTKWKDAQFSKPEYAAMVKAFEDNGFYSYGKLRNFDAMHFTLLKRF